MNQHDETYLQAAKYILENGNEKSDRTETGTISVFGMQQRYDLTKGFPLLTTKKLIWESIVSELLWFLEGSTDERRLAELRYGKDRSELKDKRTIWSDNYESFSGKKVSETDVTQLGPVYGEQWCFWKIGSTRSVIDQIENVIDSIKFDSNSRRHIVSAWNVSEIENMALPPCHCLFQFYVANGKLSCQLYQRSADFFLGVPYNIASYALLTHMIAHVCNLKVGEFIHTIGDAHIYKNHIPQIEEQITRTPSFEYPLLTLNEEIKHIDTFTMSDIIISSYFSHPAIKAKMAI